MNWVAKMASFMCFSCQEATIFMHSIISVVKIRILFGIKLARWPPKWLSTIFLHLWVLCLMYCFQGGYYNDAISISTKALMQDPLLSDNTSCSLIELFVEHTCCFSGCYTGRVSR